ncbi:MAG: hypothetical protein KTR14_09580 [Vampirovibrio sp.]|nr:hypothetical protein [Vampirovibrio sp.]
MAKRTKGQGVGEYGVAGAVIAVAAVASVTLLSNNFSELMTDVSDQRYANGAGGNNAGGGAGGPGGGNAGAGNGGGASMNAPAGTSQVQLTLANGQTMNLAVPMTAAQLQTMVETSGVNGTTSHLMANLDMVIAQMESAGEITPADANMLKALSNQGHRMASIEKVLEQNLSSYGNSQVNPVQVGQSMVTFDGQQISILDLATQVGCRMSCVGGNELNPNNNAWPETAKFVDLFQQAKGTSVMTNPVVNTLVTQLSTQIVSLSDTMESMYSWAMNGVHSGSNLPQNPAQIISKTTTKIGTQTHLNSQGICQAGGSTTGAMQTQCI